MCLTRMLERQQVIQQPEVQDLNSIDQSSTLKRLTVIIHEAHCHHVSPGQAFSRLLSQGDALVPIVMANTVIRVKNLANALDLYSDHSIGSVQEEHHTGKQSGSDRILALFLFAVLFEEEELYYGNIYMFIFIFSILFSGKTCISDRYYK